MSEAHEAYKNRTDGNNQGAATFESWCEERIRSVPLFQYWFITLKLQLLALIFVRSIRTGNFQLYIDILTKIVPWFFALDRVHYARWLPIHIRDMVTLHERHPSIHAEFVKGRFVVAKTQKLFSTMSVDQAHEQNNALVKGDGGAIGLLDNESALLRWMITGPELARLLNEFQSSTEEHEDNDIRHHSQTSSIQQRFAEDVMQLTSSMKEMGNHFMEDSNDLLVLDTMDIVNKDVTSTVRNIECIGSEQYDNYVKDRLVERCTPINDVIKKNNLPLFQSPGKRTVSKTKLQISSLKNDCALFSRLYISCQVRDGNLDEFFQHENQGWPPSLSQNGILRSGTKADLTTCLEAELPQSTESTLPEQTPRVDVVILDGAAVVNMLNPGKAVNFMAYASDRFAPYIKSHLQHVSRVDLVWDAYIENSLKSTARSKRGCGIRRRVDASSAIPGNWQSFLRVTRTKQSCSVSCPNRSAVLKLTSKSSAPMGRMLFVHHRASMSQL